MTSPAIEEMAEAELAERPTAVYRFFDAADRLLYVGITADLITRWRWHEKNSTWWADQRRIEVVWRDSRADADEEETAAIRTEQPVHNSAKRGKTPQKSFRLDKESWDDFGDSAAAIDLDRSAVIRALVDWFNGEPGAELPERPAATDE